MPGADAGAKITTTHVRILTVNDVYAEEPVRGRGGWAGLASLVRRYRASAPGHSLLCVCGDFLGGSAALVKSKGQSGVDIMDALGVDLVVPGVSPGTQHHGHAGVHACVTRPLSWRPRLDLSLLPHTPTILYAPWCSCCAYAVLLLLCPWSLIGAFRTTVRGWPGRRIVASPPDDPLHSAPQC